MLEEPKIGEQRVFKAQLALCLWVGISSFLLFCVVRYRWPRIYAVRTLRKTPDSIKPLPKQLLGWVFTIFSITDEEVLESSGLDAYVFLTFFRMGMQIFFILTLLAGLILSPIRFIFIGSYDKDDIVGQAVYLFLNDDDRHFSQYGGYLWVYPIFTYIFTAIVSTSMRKYTKVVLRRRQKYLASQNSIVDRTIRLDDIPHKFLKNNDPSVLKNFIEDLGIGKVLDLRYIYDWAPLQKLFKKRMGIIYDLELRFASLYGLRIDIYNDEGLPSALSKSSIDLSELVTSKDKQCEHIRRGLKNLKNIDEEILLIRRWFDPLSSTVDTKAHPGFKLLPKAFVTMDSVASAQMAAQAVLDPRVHTLTVRLAPAPKDIRWENLKLSRSQRLVKAYLVTFVIVLSYILLFVPVSTLATLLNLKTIARFLPSLGHILAKSKWLTTFVTGILPPLLFSLLNILLPYFYNYLSWCQGYSCDSDVEMSTLLKNFFYIFFNLFLVFTISGTASNYWSFLSDTTKIAYHLALSLKSLSLFYVDLILLQGLAMFPVRLLQIGDFVILHVIGKIILLKDFFFRTARDYRFYYYTPPVFDFGMQLPQHILIFIIVLIYSVVSTKIVASGLVYFLLGYFVYKYQLVYTCVHPPHSTGQVWSMIFRRLMVGLIIFQIFMCGTLALEGTFTLSILCVPLILFTLMSLWDFETNYLPLSKFIALRAIQSPDDFDKEFHEESSQDASDSDLAEPNYGIHSFSANQEDMLNSSQPLLRRKRSTIDEEREYYTNYVYPYLTTPLEGPWLGFEANYIWMLKSNVVNPDEDLEEAHSRVLSTYENFSIVRKYINVSEWE